MHQFMVRACRNVRSAARPSSSSSEAGLRIEDEHEDEGRRGTPGFKEALSWATPAHWFFWLLVAATGLGNGMLTRAGGVETEVPVQPETSEVSQVGQPLGRSGSSVAMKPPQTAALHGGSAPTVLYGHGDPTVQEQLMLELVNRARANPGAEAARLGIDLNEGLPPGTITDTPKPPLAFHRHLIQAARNHSDWMLDTDTFDHFGVSGTDPGDRMSAAGYPFTGSWQWGENIAAQWTTGSVNLTQFTANEHDALFQSPGHRENICEAGFDEIGLGVRQGVFTDKGTNYNAVLTTQNFARSAGTPGPLLLGVVYQDTNQDGFYTVGEGLAGVTVKPAAGTYYAVTSTSGGYALPLSATSGSLTVTASGGALATAMSKTITLKNQNIKLDFDALNAQPVQFVAATARRNGSGQFECQVTGPSGAKVIVQFSSNLVAWTDVSTNTIVSGSASFLDQQAVGSARRFYRARRTP
ncbi:MAG: CAP domain-containing protein [Verrucomicrobia bacterium]|nr:CAP domain-containing protein [Verrucomicrobiota bacterium]